MKNIGVGQILVFYEVLLYEFGGKLFFTSDSKQKLD